MSSLSCGTLCVTISIHTFVYLYIDTYTSACLGRTGSSVRFWWFGGRVTPDPFPNSEVKPPSGDGT